MSFRPVSLFELICPRCAEEWQSHSRETKCPKCGLLIEIEWPADKIRWPAEYPTHP
jgi:hypothetical protein